MEHIVSLQGTEYALSKAQIEFDAPNYFTACFLGEFQERGTRRVELPRDPELFRIVYSYLCGYNVLPINQLLIPKSMSPSLALSNLKYLVAQENLRQKFNEEHPNKYTILGYTYNYNSFSYFDPLYTTPRSTWELRTGQNVLSQNPLKDMATVSSGANLEKAAAREKLAAQRLKECHSRDWRLVGWYEGAPCGLSTPPSDPESESEDEPVGTVLIIVVEDLRRG